jgi:hypothetical protein
MFFLVFFVLCNLELWSACVLEAQIESLDPARRGGGATAPRPKAGSGLTLRRGGGGGGSSSSSSGRGGGGGAGRAYQRSESGFSRSAGLTG